jgi:hypothetical protein
MSLGLVLFPRQALPTTLMGSLLLCRKVAAISACWSGTHDGYFNRAEVCAAFAGATKQKLSVFALVGGVPVPLNHSPKCYVDKAEKPC